MDEKHDIHDQANGDVPGHATEGVVYAQTVQTEYIKPQARKLHDPAVTWEEYNYYAKRTREFEKQLEPAKMQLLSLLKRKKESAVTNGDGDAVEPKQIDLNLNKEENRLRISDQEWINASRAYRTASWGACFYLVYVPLPTAFDRYTYPPTDHDRHPGSLRRPVFDWNAGIRPWYRTVHGFRPDGRLLRLSHLARVHGR